MNKSQSYFKCEFYDDSTGTYTATTQGFDTDFITWKGLLEVFNRCVKGAGFIAPTLDEFTDGVDFENDLPAEEKQAA